MKRMGVYDLACRRGGAFKSYIRRVLPFFRVPPVNEVSANRPSDARTFRLVRSAGGRTCK